jgi:hypothetical protein
MTTRGRLRSLIRSSEDVRAILTGTCTRLTFPVKLPPVSNHQGKWAVTTIGGGSTTYHDGSPVPEMAAIRHTGTGKTLVCPYGQVGERLWVKERWQHDNYPAGPYEAGCTVFYRADYLDDPHGPDGELSREGRYRTWQPAARMPRNASRITIEVTRIVATHKSPSAAVRSGVNLELFAEELVDLSGWQWIIDIAPHLGGG